MNQVPRHSRTSPPNTDVRPASRAQRQPPGLAHQATR